MHRGTLAGRLFLAQLVFILCTSGGIAWGLYQQAEESTYEETGQRMLAVAGTVAASSTVRTAVDSPEPALQDYAREVMDRVGIDFLTIMDTDRTRFTHRNPEQIGKAYIGSVDQALAGESFTETYTGTLGPSVRAITPVYDDAGNVTALVAAGITVDRVGIARDARLPELFAIDAAALALSAVGSYVLSRYLRRATRGLRPAELTQLYAFYDAALHSVREGLVLLNDRGQLVLYNDEAAVLLGLPPAGTAAPGQELPDLPGPLASLLRSGRNAREEIHLTGERILVVNQSAAVSAGPHGRRFGTVTTLRDHTDVESLTGELASMRTLADALSAQAHEHANRVHTLASLIELGRSDEALRFATADLEQSQQLADEVLASVEEPAVTALLMGKAAQARERGIALDIVVESGTERFSGAGVPPVELVTIIGNLLDNAFDAAEHSVVLQLGCGDGQLLIDVQDDGPGVDPSILEHIFEQGFSTKELAEGRLRTGRGIGLALVRQAVTRLGGSIRVLGGPGACFSVELPVPAQAPAPAPLAEVTP
ncbi:MULTISPECIES: sensor histidine kinase [unclassified Arthrobacter]|uniref:sensor histidine kinase n=1 Tax=unclassified Arthrobacter TaxID=235627 RepID=UPI0024DFE137|nr:MULTISPECIES: sensor histidine kinase [unclassified Arthrobacter]MCC9144990.1 sensor histidine kinase [Arthrobacter sp. zg-Y919]MDK1276218.1 sensor histidine kinase [Arthrobacter sp. zg.Y919]WIB02170.1 sensor histidine kinase [Arthrobacter sp. zg-Y919]